jgi:argininosuccinate lyase
MLWGGRFSGETDDLLRAFGDSFSFDRRLADADIRGSVAYAGALRRAGLITEAEHAAIVDGLAQVRDEFASGQFEPAPGDEDIHTAVERRLTEIVGPAAGKLHTGRSRNDQVALDARLWLVDAVRAARSALTDVQAALVEVAAAHRGLVMPGYTHLQPAQPVTFAHWLLSFFWMFERDQGRLADCERRAAVSPLGAGALSGTPFPIDRAALAADLGLPAITENSLDAVSDRDFLAEYLFCAALIGVHVSRLAEDMILYSTGGFGFITIGEAYTTGSSLMPQKRNPDALELARGKSGRLVGGLVGLLVALKGLPSTYDKDMQEDKEPAFDAADTLALMLPVVAGVIRSLTPHPDAMRAALDASMLATDVADYLVERGVPFREAHTLVGRLVRAAEERGVPLDKLPLADYQAVSLMFDEEVYAVFDFDRAVGRRVSAGGTAPEAVDAQIGAAQAILSERGG